MYKTLVIILCVCHFSFGLTNLYHFSRKELSDVKQYLQKAVLETDLNIPNFVEEDVEGFVQTKYTNPDHQVLCGVVIENYSTYSLAYPVSSNYSHYNDKECRGLRFVQQPPAIIKPGDIGIFIVDNGEKRGYDVCGSISWQILKPDGVHNVTRKNKWSQENNVKLNIEFDVTYSGSCGKTDGRVNRFKSFISPQFKHHRGHRYFSSGSHAIRQYSHQFLIETEMDFGCSPLLQLRFLPIEQDAERRLWKADESQEPLFASNVGSNAMTQINTSKNFWITIICILLGLCGLTIMCCLGCAYTGSLVRKNRRERVMPI